MSGVPVYIKIKLHIGDPAENKIAPHNLTGLSVEKADSVFNQVIRQTEDALISNEKNIAMMI
ncbi:hypothetical protein ACWOFR_05305 [Carnobacterium gallinarum]|uniref:hypothetical protein n=1 Tax=Carnobacterium gallinarum TaxID=2749 RepID=UPI00054DB234|nr:hypothetical protein [Carnobacterium gallinarum]